MSRSSSPTETVVRNHLQSFLDQRGLVAILSDYADDACLLCEDKTYRGKHEIGEFFDGFLASLPPGSVSAFSLRSLRAEAELAYITWSAGGECPLGTDTFVVRDGKIVLQTFAMYVPQAA